MMDKYTVIELKKICKKQNLKGYSGLKKQELLNLLKENESKGVLYSSEQELLYSREYKSSGESPKICSREKSLQKNSSNVLYAKRKIEEEHENDRIYIGEGEIENYIVDPTRKIIYGFIKDGKKIPLSKDNVKYLKRINAPFEYPVNLDI